MKRFDRVNVILELAIILINITTITVAISKYNSPAIVNAEEALNFTEFPLPTAYSYPRSITTGPDGNLWFTESGTNGVNGKRIGRITPSGVITEFDVSKSPVDITAGPDGNLWFTEGNPDVVGRITTSGVITEFPITPGMDAKDITAGSDGNLWFTEFNYSKIGRISPSGEITEFQLPDINSGPWGITSGPDGNMWFTESTGKIGSITPHGVITEYVIFKDNGSNNLRDITLGSDGNLWFTETNGDIGRFSIRGKITHFSRSNYEGGFSEHIISGPDGNLWFTDYSHIIGKITTDGIFTIYTAPTTDIPYGIAAGPDGNIWLTEPWGNKIWRMNLPVISLTPTPILSPSPTLKPEPPGQNKDDTLLSPFNNGVTWSVTSGYYNNRKQDNIGCWIGRGPDHCRNQLFGLDIVPDQQGDPQILAPGNGKVIFKGKLPDENCMGVKIALDNGLNLNVCHFASYNVEEGDRVLRGKVLGTRSMPWVHLSMDDRYRIGTLCPGKEHCYLPVPFDGQHTIDGIAFDPDSNGETVVLPYPLCEQRKNISCEFKVGFQQYQGFKGTSTNIAIP